MIRYSLLAAFIAFLSAYAFKDWFKSLCGLVVLMAVLERPDMPRSIMGIPGLNVWNILLFFVLLGWLASKKHEKRFWDMPGYMNFILLSYLFVVIVSSLRTMLDYSPLVAYAQMLGSSPDIGMGSMVIDYLVNTIKFAIPGILIYEGCRDEERAKWAVSSILVAGFFLAIQIIKEMPLSMMTDGDRLQKRAVRILDRRVGYHRVDLATLMAGLSWAFYAARTVFTNKFIRLFLLFAAMICFLALSLTGGRSGYLAWAACGTVLALVRWRGLILLGPVVVLIMFMTVPAVEERLIEGFTEESHETGTAKLGVDTVDSRGNDLYAITSGRVIVWPEVIEGIKERPYLGWGRKGYIVSGVLPGLVEEYGIWIRQFGHPHNAYLQLMIDAGIVGTLPVMVFYFLICLYSLRLFRRKDPLSVMIGGLTFALVSTQLAASVGAQTFYPREGTLFMWAAIGLCLRFYFSPPEGKTETEQASNADDGRRIKFKRPSRTFLKKQGRRF